ncbi:MAG TPA: hypothetical protein VK640_04290 [Actinomycetes bacterium]|nr:hypothetical protein [Actinomycetes bacterium]
MSDSGGQWQRGTEPEHVATPQPRPLHELSRSNLQVRRLVEVHVSPSLDP